jgi:dipeptidyl aminopeptidase/acylaminoacyl peptidase
MQPGWTAALENVFVDLLGGSREQQPQAYRAASPVTYIRRGAPPVLTIHGTSDAIVPYDQAKRLDAALRAHGAFSRLDSFDGVGHGGTWVPQDFDRFEAATLPFLDEHLKKN